jgi:hypothetical protein
MARTGRLAILAAAILVLGGCGGSAATLAPPAATPTAAAVTTQPLTAAAPTPAPTPTPTPAASASSALAPLASTYAGIAAKGEAVVVRCLGAKAAASGSLVKAKAAARACLADSRAYVADLKAVSWGPLQPQADNLIAAIDAVNVLLARMANATTDGAFTDAYDQLPSAEANLLVAATAFRRALGLPPVLP